MATNYVLVKTGESEEVYDYLSIDTSSRLGSGGTPYTWRGARRNATMSSNVRGSAPTGYYYSPYIVNKNRASLAWTASDFRQNSTYVYEVIPQFIFSSGWGLYATASYRDLTVYRDNGVELSFTHGSNGGYFYKTTNSTDVSNSRECVRTFPSVRQQNDYIDITVTNIGQYDEVVLTYSGDNEDRFEVEEDRVRVWLSANETAYPGETFRIGKRMKKSTVVITKTLDGGTAADPAGVGTVSGRLSDGTVLAGEVSGAAVSFTVPAGETATFSFSLTAAEAVLWGAYGFGAGRTQTYTLEDAPDSDTPIEVGYYLAKKPLYSVTLVNPAQGGTLSVTNPATPSEDGKYVGGNITVSGVPSAGWGLSRVNVYNSSDSLIGTYEVASGTSVVISLNRDIIVRAEFAQRTYEVTAAVDSASATAITSATVAFSGESVVYGSTATFTAVVPSATGVSFAGWYDAEGELVSTANPYSCTVEDDFGLVAKAKVSVTAGVSVATVATGDSSTISLSVDGSVVVSGTGTHSFNVVLGDSFSYALSLGVRTGSEKWALDSWRTSASGGTVLPYSAAQSVAPTAPVAMYAIVSSAQLATKNLHVYVARLDDTNVLVSKEDTDADAITFSGGIVQGQSSEWELIESGGEGDISPSTETPWIAKTVGVASVDIAAKSMIGVSSGGETANVAFVGYAHTVPSTGMPTLFSRELGTEILLTQDAVVYAVYGVAELVTTTLAYANGSDATMGTVAIAAKSDADPSSSIAADGMSATSHQGTTLTFRVTPSNGFKFMGWYTSPQAIGNPLANPSLVTAQRTLFARFAQDDHAICEWEGEGDNKQMIWRSKTYEASKPFNPAACRVDALGYVGDGKGTVLALTVDMFSAPNSKATATARLTNITSQDARRLPVRRMERYMQINVKCNREVDALLVGTAMEGLAT